MDYHYERDVLSRNKVVTCKLPFMPPPPRNKKEKCHHCGSILRGGSCQNHACEPYDPHFNNMEEKVAMAIEPGAIVNDKYPMLWKHCSCCGCGLLIACGYNALGITRREMLGILGNEGWTVAPQLICRNCTCPLSEGQRAQAKALFKGRQYEELKRMHETYRAIYGPIVDKYFLTMNHMDVCYRVGLANAGGSV